MVRLQPEAHKLSANWYLLPAILLLAVLRWVYAFNLSVNSDEPQHLHVTWAWTQGLLPFRDIFDNHAPLFSLLYAPLLNAIGDRADIVPWMRLANLPWYALTLWLTYRLGKSLFDRRIGLAAAAVTALQSTFFLKSVEYRPDLMWAAVWLAAMVVAVEGSLTQRRTAAVGLLMGLALAVSIKTAVLLSATGVALAVVLGSHWLVRARPNPNAIFRFSTYWVAGFVVVPAIVVVAFAIAGAFPAMRYCLFDHNVVAGLGRWSQADAVWMHLVAVVLLAPVIYFSYRLLDRGGWTDKSAKAVWVCVAAIAYLLLRNGFQPFVDKQDLLPLTPLLVPFFIAIIRAMLRRFFTPVAGRRLFAVAIGTILALQMSYLLMCEPPWHDNASRYADELRRVLTLTKPGQFVMDSKGESIFRPRPTYWIFENVTLYSFVHGVIDDDVSQRMADCHISLVFGTRWPERLGKFIEANYVPLDGRIRIADRHGATSQASTSATGCKREKYQQARKYIARAKQARVTKSGSELQSRQF